MLTTTEIYRLIRHKFNVRVRGDNLPLASKGTRLDLVDLWNDAGYKTFAEIGVFRGEFSNEILTRVNDSVLYCIDPWAVYKGSHLIRTQEKQDENFSIAKNRLRNFENQDRVKFIKDYSQNAVQTFQPNSLDAVFIDGDHSFEHAVIDIIRWSKIVKIGGMIAVHDYVPMRNGGVIEAVNGFTRCNMIQPWYITREVLPTAFWIKEKEY